MYACVSKCVGLGQIKLLRFVVPVGYQGEALEPQPVSNLDPTYHTPPNTKHTCELVAVVQDQAGECHALEHLDVAWGNGVDRWKNEGR